MTMLVPSAAPVITDTDIDAVTGVLRSGILANGPEGRSLESEFAQLCGASRAVSLANGTVALHLAALALGLGSGDTVLVPAFTFAATANAFLVAGCQVATVDIDPSTFNLSMDSLATILDRTRARAVVVVDLYGSTAGTDDVIGLARSRGCLVVEDACQAHGAETEMGKVVGSRADMTAFSFYATKNIVSGEGGLLTTNDDALADSVLRFRSHGSMTEYRHQVPSLNYRLGEMEAALARSQLSRLGSNSDIRRSTAAKLNTWCADAWGYRVALPQWSDLHDRTHVFHQYTVRFDDTGLRDQVAARLRSAGVDVRHYYPYTVNDLPGVVRAEMSSARLVRDTVMSLPVHPGLSEEQLQYMRGAIADTASVIRG